MVFQSEVHVSIPNKDLLSWIFDHVPYDINKPIYVDTVDPSSSISNAQARILIRQIAAGLRASGLKRGDTVCVHSFNNIYYPMFFLGIIAAGGIFAGTNPAYTQNELVHHIETAGIKFVISEPEIIQHIAGAAKQCQIPRDRVWVLDAQNQPVPAGHKSFRDLLNHGQEDWPRFDDEATSRTATAAYLFSSGTTGNPKAVTLSHYNLVAQHEIAWAYKAPDFEIKRVVCIPMFHAAAVPVVHSSAIKDGCPTYIMKRFELEPYLKNIERFQTTEMSLVPPLVIAIVMSPMSKKYSLKSIKTAVCGAAPLSKDTQAKLQELLAEGATFNQVWGMTETSCIGTRFYYPEHDTSGSVGKTMPNTSMKLIDDDGKDITAYDVRGELCIKGPQVVSEYHNNPKANAESFDSDGFFRTGDIAYCASETGKWYIVDRKKELIKVRGFQVAPPELESVLLSHPEIVDAAVIGVKKSGDETQEYPRAYVVRRAGSSIDEQQVLEFMEGKLAVFKRITGGVKFIAEVPKNPSGKILKKVLREEADKEESSSGKPKL